MRGADLSGEFLIGPFFANTSLRGANFREASLSQPRFRFADLTDADFTDSRLVGAWFELTCLSGVTFAGASFGDMPKPLSLPGVEPGFFSAIDTQEVGFSSSFGRRVDFTGADLRAIKRGGAVFVDPEFGRTDPPAKWRWHPPSERLIKRAERACGPLTWVP